MRLVLFDQKDFDKIGRKLASGEEHTFHRTGTDGTRASVEVAPAGGCWGEYNHTDMVATLRITKGHITTMQHFANVGDLKRACREAGV